MQRSGWERAVVGFAEQGREEADEKALGYASLHGNRLKRTYGCSEADEGWLWWASLYGNM